MLFLGGKQACPEQMSVCRCAAGILLPYGQLSEKYPLSFMVSRYSRLVTGWQSTKN